MSNFEIKEIKILDIKIGERARRELDGKDNESLETLKESLKRDGLINPIVVMEIDDPGFKYLLIAGERRLTAATQLGWNTIQAKVMPKLNETQQAYIELFENIARKQMTWQEELQLKKKIHSIMSKSADRKWTYDDTAELFGVNKSTISRDLKLAEAIEAVPKLTLAKNKREAMRALDKFALDIQRERIATELLKGSKDSESKVKKIVQSYQVGDFFDKIKDVPDGSVDLIDFDPPWGLSGDIKHDNLKKIHGDKLNQAMDGDFDKFYGEALELCVQKLRGSGWILVWFMIENYERVRRRLEELKLKFNTVPAIWYKGNGQTNAPHLYLRSTAEFFFYATKDGFLHTEGINNVFEFEVDYGKAKRHPNQKPISLWQHLLDVFAFKGCFVLSPFAGSGNTILAAYTKNMTALGYDLNKDYYNSFVLEASKMFGEVQVESSRRGSKIDSSIRTVLDDSEEA